VIAALAAAAALLGNGGLAVPRPVRGVPRTPQNPFMAPNGRSEIHNDGWQTDAYRSSGPLGRSPQRLFSVVAPLGDCGSIAFDRRGRLVSVCVGVAGPQLHMFDPVTLATLATYPLPPRADHGGNIFQDFTGGGYFYLDNHDRVLTATTTRHIYVIAERATAPGFRRVHDYDLSRVLTPSEKITSALPDEHGLLWFVARRDGVVGTLDFASGSIHTIRLGHGAVGEIENSFATDEQPDDAGAAHPGEAGGRARGNPAGVYIATNRRLYRFAAGRNHTPTITWQIAYPNTYQHKPGQVDDGTGTTPTVMPGGYVNITDNADPMDVMVYRTAPRGRRRTVCRVPVFRRGASDTENSLIAAGRSMIVENNYGYDGPPSISGGKLTAPGFARVDINRNGIGCHRVWTNSAERAPSVVSKLSLANGLIYTYTKGPGVSDPWYWTAIDFRNGRTVFKRLAGTGSFAYNNNYAGIALGPNRTAYLGVLGGLLALRDGR
jgi:hypothetical protein